MHWIDEYIDWLKDAWNSFLNLFSSKESNQIVASKKSNKKIDYLLNDPTTPKLKISVPEPEKPKGMNYTVRGYRGGGFPWNSKEGHAASCAVTLAGSIKLAEEYAKKPLNNWAATRNLQVVPHAGKDLNAYYDRRGLKFFHYYDKNYNKEIYTVESVEIVAHELGHAILDKHRPDFWNLQALEIWGFHEAYADIHAILTMLLRDEVVDCVLNQTEGDLKRPSIITNLAEEMGNVVYGITKGKGGRKPGALRSALNDFKYTPPEKLPYDTPDNKLGGECHSFGKLFLGAWYEMFVGIYEELRKKHGAKKSLKMAKNIAGEYVTQGMMMAPATSKFYDACARAMIAYDKNECGGQFGTVLNNVFKRRKILKPQIRHLASESLGLLDLSSDDEVIEHSNGFSVRKKNQRVLSLVDNMGLSAQAANPLFNLDIEVAADSYYEFDKVGALVFRVDNTLEEAIEAARVCLVHLDRTKQVSDSTRTMFHIEDVTGKKSKLVRSHFE